MGEVKVGDGFFGFMFKERLGEVMGVDGNISEERLESEKQLGNFNEYFSLMFK